MFLNTLVNTHWDGVLHLLEISMVSARTRKGIGVKRECTACCSQGLGFELDGDYKYSDDYPAEEDNICVVGTFDVCEEDGNSYCVLRKAIFVKGE